MWWFSYMSSPSLVCLSPLSSMEGGASTFVKQTAVTKLSVWFSATYLVRIRWWQCSLCHENNDEVVPINEQSHHCPYSTCMYVHVYNGLIVSLLVKGSTCRQVDHRQIELHTNQEVWQYFLSRDWAGSKWHPVHHVQEQLQNNHSIVMQKLL